MSGKDILLIAAIVVLAAAMIFFVWLNKHYNLYILYRSKVYVIQIYPRTKDIYWIATRDYDPMFDEAITLSQQHYLYKAALQCAKIVNDHESNPD